ncbi:MAG: OmpH family outer membrane protein [Chitinophagaceae bacterium]|nr:OmpH family outer membrane protein [Chitinophagaceae bacterium]
MKKLLTVVLVAAGLLLVNSQTQAQTKIGFVNTEELFSVLPDARKADSALQQYQEVLKKTGEDYQQELEEKAKKFNTDSTKMTAVQKESERRKLQDLYSRVVNYNQEAQQQLQQKQQELIAPLQKMVNELVNKVAKANGYTHVFSREALLVVPDGDNLLPLIKKQLGLK